MLRAVVDPGVLTSSLISSRGALSELVRRSIDGEFPLLWSPQLLDELASVCSTSSMPLSASRAREQLQDCHGADGGTTP